jgi:CDP-6-deoxy-D-xylo-4-hexulose-3-dehydrase
MKDQLVPQPPFGPETLRELECIKSGELSMGRFVKAFETEFAKYLGVGYAVMVNSGSSANLLAVSVLKTLDPRIKTVGIPAVNWSTSIAPVVQLGLTPILLDVNPRTLVVGDADPMTQLDVMFNVHLLGQPSTPSYGPGRRPRYQIDDCCEALGTHVAQGSFSAMAGAQLCDMGTFSFFYSHHLVTIEGGMITTNSDALYEELVMQRAHGWTRDLPAARRQAWEQENPEIDPRFLFPTLGYNVRPMEIQGELGLLQLPQLEAWHARRVAIATQLRQAVPAGFLPYDLNPGRHSWFAFPLVLEAGGVARRKLLVNHFQMADIATRPIVAGNLAAQPFMQRFGIRNLSCLPHARHVQTHGIYLAISPFMTDAAVENVCQTLSAWS